MTQITITLNKIKAHDPCSDGWEAVLKGRGKAAADDEEFPLSEAFNSNKMDDVVWALRCLPEHDRLWRKFAVWCARQFQDQLTDERSLAALDVAWLHSDGEATDEELQVAWDDAWAAARDALAYAWTAALGARAARAASVAERAARDSASDAAWDTRTAWTDPSDADCDAAMAAALAAWAARKAKLIQILDAGEWVE